MQFNSRQSTYTDREKSSKLMTTGGLCFCFRRKFPPLIHTGGVWGGGRILEDPAGIESPLGPGGVTAGVRLMTGGQNRAGGGGGGGMWGGVWEE